MADNPFHFINQGTNKGKALLALGQGSVAGKKAQSRLTLSGVIADRQTLTIDGDVFELVDLSTDSTLDIGTAWNNTNAVVTQTLTGHTLEVGDYVAVESEIATVSHVSGDSVSFSRTGQAGTTVVAHATGTTPIEVATATALTAGAITVPILSTTATDALSRLAGIIGAASTRAWEFVKASATLGLIFSKVSGARAATVATTITNGTVITPTYGGSTHSVSPVYTERRVPTAAEVTAGAIYIKPPGTPVHAITLVTITATGVALAWDGATTLDAATGLVKVDNAGTTDWTASHTITVIVFCAPVACSAATVTD